MKKLNSLQLGRATAVVSVLVYHLTGLSLEYQHGYFYYPWTQVLKAGVDIFFVISGVVMVVTTYQKLEQRDTGKRFLIHRVSRIYPPYLFLTAILTVFWVMHPSAVNTNTGGVNLFSSYTLWPAVRQLPLVQVGWTLSFEMMFYLVFFCIITWVGKAWFQLALAVWSLAVIAGCFVIALESSGTLLRHFPRADFVFSPYVLEFVTGCFVGLALLKGRCFGGRTSVMMGLALFLSEALIFQAIGFRGDERLVFRVLLFGPPAALFVYGLLAWERGVHSLRVPHWVVRCGDISYSIYLVHLLVFHFVYRYAWYVFDHNGFRPLFLLVATGIAIGSSIMFYKLVERPLSLLARTHLERLFNIPTKPTVIPAPIGPIL